MHKRFILDCRVLHADETPVALLDPGAGKTRRTYMWAYARSWHDAIPGVIYEFCRGRGAQYPVAFLGGDDKLGERRWCGTLLTDRYGAYDTVVDPQRPDVFHPCQGLRRALGYGAASNVAQSDACGSSD